ncbi:MAG: plasmid pRiA4b ORF-3 family protein [Chloroflexi bacterium]|nr:plasmid pRiA4b ORF-3 family protein [Chloroflexota bacterium]
MARQTSQGKCNLCGKSFSKQAMTRHLDKCKTEHLAKGSARILQLQIEGRGASEYWLHVEAPANASLQTLDRFLRDIWLECCGHLSMFTIAGQVYDVAPEPDPWSGRKPKGMSAKLGDVLAPGHKFTHEYDFGTTTELALKVVAERQGATKRIEILARNDPPMIPCAQCGKPAIQVCSMCIYEGPKAWLCDEHAEEHDCGEDYFLPVVNSPRVGMCGYTGNT